MSVIPQLLNTLRTNEIHLRLVGDRLECEAPKGKLSPALLEKLREHKPELIAFLQGSIGDTGHDGILRRDRHGDIPASFGQQRIWFINRIGEDKSVFNLPVLTWRLSGRFCVQTLVRAVETVVGRHSILRSNYKLIDGKPHFSVSANPAIEFSLVDLEGVDTRAADRALAKCITISTSKPFDLEHDRLLRVCVIRLGIRSHVVQVTVHHIVFDGWSIEVFTNELVRFYDALDNQSDAALPLPPIQYTDYALWQRERLRGEVLERELAYWREQLQGLIPVLALPLDRARLAVQSFRGAVQPFELDAELTAALKSLSREAGVTLFMTLFAVYAVLLHRYSGQDDIAVGVPIANRSRRETEGLIGFFVNTLVMRVSAAADPTVAELLHRVRCMALDAYAHQNTPFEKVVEALAPKRDLSYSPLFATSFILQTMDVAEKQALGDLTVESLVSASNTAGAVSDLTLSMVETNGKLVGNMEYNTDLFDAATVDRMVRHYTALLREVLRDAGRSIAALPLLSDAERHELLYRWNDTAVADPLPRCLHQLFEAQAARDPAATALIFAEQTLSYGELNGRANRLALQLRDHGVAPETLVGICLERSLEMVIGLLAILKAGGAYVPLDPAYPRERLAYMLEDARIRVLLTDTAVQERTGLNHPLVVHLDRLPTGPAVPNLDVPVHPHNLAYVIYTSGSTGRPKGAMLTHAGAVNLATHQGVAFAMSPEKRTLQFSSLSFDAAVSEIFTSLAYGAAIVLTKKEILQQARPLLALLEKSETTTITLPPSLLAHLDMSTFPDVDTIVLAGEKSNADLARSLCAKARQVLNAYGPTETSVCACLGPITEHAADVITIGKPLVNMRLYVLDRLHHPTPIGVTGELYIAGIGVGRGYWQRPGLTAERFLPNPWGRQPGERMYRTGDLARVRPDGNVEFLGRQDHQVKLRGFRIELGEVEAVLARHPAVREVVVIAPEQRPRGRELVAYVVGNRADDLEGDALRSHARARLPDYMVPAAFVVLDRLPLTPNGKVDRAALPEPVYRPAAGSDPDYSAPRNATEELLCGIWSALLGVEQVGIHDNFFDLGGHSLLAFELIALIEQRLGTEIEPGRFFRDPTVAGTVSLLVPKRSQSAENVVRLSDADGQSLLFCLHQASGLVSCYQILARTLSPRMTVYGIGPLMPEQGEAQPTTLESAADRYADCLLHVQSDGPIRLLGWSFGAVVAHAVAQALLNRGREIERLFLIDPTDLPAGEVEEPSDVDKPLIFLRQLFDQKGLRLDADIVDVDQLRAMPPSQLLSECAALADRHLGIGRNGFNGLLTAFSRSVSWLHGYRPTIDSRCGVELIRSTGGSTSSNRCDTRSFWSGSRKPPRPCWWMPAISICSNGHLWIGSRAEYCRLREGIFIMQSLIGKLPQSVPEGRQSESASTQVRFEQLTLMLTEVCNLDCWMCDFRKSEKLTKKLPLSIDEILELLRHPLWNDTLRKITLTGGEPFAYSGIDELANALRKEMSGLHINISTNATLIKRMMPVLEQHYDSRKLTLLVSVDGIDAHDVQRGEPGLFEKTTRNLNAIRTRYPDLPILIKFTVTPTNYHELYKTFEYFVGNGYVITAKMVENNPNYTNKLSHQVIEKRLAFTREMIADIRAQLTRAVAMLKKSRPRQRFYAFQLRELIDSLENDWTRTASCQTPTKGVFIDADLNVFTCKEYGPVLNLCSEPIEAMVQSKQFHDVIANERCNTGQCTRCTSQMQIRAKGRGWLSFFQFIKR